MSGDIGAVSIEGLECEGVEREHGVLERQQEI